MRALKVLFVLVLLSALAFATDSPFTGTWKLNLGKSTQAAGDTTKSDVHHIVVDKETLIDSQESTDANGDNKVKVEAKIDGKDYPVKGDPTTDTISYQHKGPRELAYIAKKDGKVVSNGTVVVSEDGRITTVNYTFISADGKTETGTSVYDKQ
jgi:hypothetical protein